MLNYELHRKYFDAQVGQANFKQVAPSLPEPPPATASPVNGRGNAVQRPGTLFLAVQAAYNLTNKDTGLLGDVSDPYVVVRLGNQLSHDRRDSISARDQKKPDCLVHRNAQVLVGVALVEQFSETFVATVADEKFSGLSMLQWLRSRRATKVEQSAGQYVIDVLGSISNPAPDATEDFSEVMLHEKVSVPKQETCPASPTQPSAAMDVHSADPGVGGSCRSYDLTTGFDFTKAEVREQVTDELKRAPPDLLVLSPPCTDEGGWFNLNACTMDPNEYLRRVRRSRLFIRFCCKLFEQQVQAGGRAIFEHPKGSKLWTYPEVRALVNEHHLLSCHMCRFGLRIPGSDKLIRKATHLLVTHENMRVLAKECPGSKQPKHECHQTIAGSDPAVGRISTFAGKYTPNFVESVMDTVPRYMELKQQCLAVCSPWSSKQQDEVLAAKPDLSADKSDEDLMKVASEPSIPANGDADVSMEPVSGSTVNPKARPPSMREQDFLDMMKEVVPKLIEHATNPATASASPAQSSSPRVGDQHKRVLEDSDAVEPPSNKPRIDAVCEVLSVEDKSAQKAVETSGGN
ncbi:unnamed protein product [Cladocopium goreaui]|uniref:Ankyrin repeat domain-containing protein 17 n=1 Tax=Cladocopium goreaui TaxID=2562237 RepID=A0A9P1GKN2_9DINO|nr:unnamed protein product [Cladocopium goreaui]